MISGTVAATPGGLDIRASSAVPAGIGDRFFARLVDTAVMIAPMCAIGLCVSATTSAEPESAVSALLAFLVIAWYAFLLLYEFVILVAWDGQSVGKRMLRIKVIRLDGYPMTWGTAASRVYLQMLASLCTGGLAGLLFALSPLFDSSRWKRGWPDRIASTVVIRADR